MARGRAQSRQRFQPLVNRLVAEGLVEARPNPAHKQSPLIALTPLGQTTVTRIVDLEKKLREQVRVASSVRQVAQAWSVLRDVRSALEQQLPRLLADAARRRKR